MMQRYLRSLRWSSEDGVQILSLSTYEAVKAVRTFHVSEGVILSPQAVRGPINVCDRFFSQGDPDHFRGLRMRLVDALHDLVDGLNGGLTEGVDVSIGYLAEVDGASNAVLDVVGLSTPLVRLE